jgi:hypothetical protein
MSHGFRPYALLLMVAAVQAGAQAPLSEGAFQQTGSVKGTVIMQVNWGRYWKCGTYENAQLQRLAFRRLTDLNGAKGEMDWELAPTSTLLVRSSFQPYVFLIEPGERRQNEARGIRK